MPKKILACDDEPYILAAVSRIVKDEGFSLITAKNGEEALRLAKVDLPDLILLDIKMPRIDGFDVCRTLKSDPDTQGIPIILLTAMGQEQDAQLGMACGAQQYITKPFSPRDLKKRLHGILDSADRQSGLESLQDSVHSLTEELLTIYEELTLLYSLTARLGRLADEDEIAAAALREAKEVLSADSGWVVLWDSESPRVPRGCNLGIGPTIVDEVNTAVIYPLYQERKRRLILHALEPKGPGENPDQPRRLLASSITIGQAPEGYLCLGRSGDHRIFTSADQKLIDAVASITAVELENVRLQHSELEKRRMTQELEMARRIQQWLLPRDLCCCSFLDGAGLNEPCYEIGGDYYDLFPLTKERCLMVIADVTGKGAPASLQAALMQGVVQGCSKHSVELLTVMSTLNECLLARAVEGNYPTAFLAALDQTGQLTYTSAGHPPAILIRRTAEICELRDGGIFLGFLADPKYPLGTAQLEPGDLIVLYSDGVTDAENGDRETFGPKRVLDWAKTQAGRCPLEVRESLLSVVKDFCGGHRQGDDITALIVRYCGKETAREASSRINM